MKNTHMRGYSHSLSEWLSNISHPFRHPLSLSLQPHHLLLSFFFPPLVTTSLRLPLQLALLTVQQHQNVTKHIWVGKIMSGYSQTLNTIFNSSQQRQPQLPLMSRFSHQNNQLRLLSLVGLTEQLLFYTSTSENKNGPCILQINYVHTLPESLTAGFLLQRRVMIRSSCAMNIFLHVFIMYSCTMSYYNVFCLTFDCMRTKKHLQHNITH